MSLDMWRDLPILLAAPAQTLFVLLYTVRPLGAGQWWRDFTGRAIGLKSLALCLLFDVAVVGLLLSWPFWEYVVVALYWAVAAAVYYQLVALIHERRPVLRALVRWRARNS